MGGIPGVATDYRGAPCKNEHVLTHVPSKLPSLLTSSLNSSTGLRAYGSWASLYIKKIVYYVQLEPWRKGKRPDVQSLSDDIGLLSLAVDMNIA